MKRSRSRKVVIPVVLIAVAVVGANRLVATKSDVPAAVPEEKVWVVETAAVAFTDEQPDLVLFGEVVAAREVALRARVGGPVMSVADSFVDGGTVAAGDVLVTIDPFDFEQDLVERKAGLDEAKARRAEMTSAIAVERAMLVEDERQLAITGRDVARRQSLVGNAVSEKGLDEARMTLSRAEAQRLGRQQAISTLEARIEQQAAVIARAEAAVARAERALADTALLAPFAGYIAEASAQPGEQLSRGDLLARLIDSGRLEVRFHMSETQFGRAFADAAADASRAAEVRWRIGDRVRRFAAEVDRIDSEIDPASGGVTAYARFTEPGENAFAGLRPGAFVDISVPGRRYRQVARLPATALHDDTTVYVVVEDRLQSRAVALERRDGESVLVVGELGEGEQVAVTRFTEIGPGVKVNVR
jgi:membrane fusion protein, multidrug efflux system